MPFKSEAQRKYLWANEPGIARDWTDKHGSGIAKALGGRIGLFEGGGMTNEDLAAIEAHAATVENIVSPGGSQQDYEDRYNQMVQSHGGTPNRPPLTNQGGGDGIIGPLPPGKTETLSGLTVEDILTKETANKKIAKMMLEKSDEEKQEKIFDTAEAALKAWKVGPEVSKDVLRKLTNKINVNIITDTNQGIQFLKNELGVGYIPTGKFTGLEVGTELGPLSLDLTKNVGEKLDYSAALDLGTPSEKYWADENISPITGEVEYSPDKGLTGNLAANLGIVKAGIDFNNPASILDVGYNLGYEGDKVGIEATGAGTSGQIGMRLDPFTGTVSYPDKNWTLGIDQALDKSGNLRLKGGLGSDDYWSAGFKWSKGIDQRPKIVDYNIRPKEESALKQYLSQFETPTSYEQDIFADKGPPEYFPNVRSRVNWDPYNLYAKGGMAGLLGE